MFIIPAVLMSGCTSGQDITPVVRAIPEVQEFLKEHPNAKITVTYWSKEESTNLVDEISKQCDKTTAPAAMYKAVISEEDVRSVSWIDAETKTVICSTLEGAGGTQSPTLTPAQTSVATPSPVATSTQIITPTPEITSTATEVPAQDSLELKDGYTLKLARVEGMNEVRSPDGTLTITKGSNVKILMQLNYGKTISEQLVPEGTSFNLYDDDNIIVKADFKTIFLGTSTYMIQLENLVQYDMAGTVIFTKDIVTLTTSHPQ